MNRTGNLHGSRVDALDFTGVFAAQEEIATIGSEVEMVGSGERHTDEAQELPRGAVVEAKAVLGTISRGA